MIHVPTGYVDDGIVTEEGFYKFVLTESEWTESTISKLFWFGRREGLEIKTTSSTVIRSNSVYMFYNISLINDDV